MKEFLSRNRVRFEVALLTEPENRAELERRGVRGGPLTLVAGEPVAGFDKVALRSALERAGLLESSAVPFAAPRARRETGARRPIAGCVAVACFLADSVVFLEPRGSGDAATDGGNAVELPGHPIALEPCPLGGTLAVVCYEAGAVTFLSLASGAPAWGSLEASTVATGSLPLHAVAHPRLPRLYVSGSESRDITVLDPRTGAYAFGVREASTFTLPDQPGVMALDRAGEILYVRLRGGAVVMLDARDLSPRHGELETSTFRTGRGRGLALSDDGERLLVPEALDAEEGLGVYCARTGAALRPRLPTAATPFAITAHPARPILYLSCFGPRVVELRDARSGDYLFGSGSASSVEVGSGARALLVDPQRELLWVSCFDDAEVLILDARTGRYRNGSRAASRLVTGAGPRGMALLP